MAKYILSYFEVDKICRRYGIRSWGINKDGSINCGSDVYLNDEELTELPIKFNRVEGDFSLADNRLTSLEGCPKYVGRNFSCADNKLTSLRYSPIEVGNNFNCRNNNLINLKYAPKFVGNFFCDNNDISSLEGCPSKINGDFYCADNNLRSLEYAPSDVIGDFCANKNSISNLKHMSKVFSRIWLDDNPLPEEIVENFFYIRSIIKLQDDYGIWNSDGSFNKYRFKNMMEEIVDSPY